MGQPMSTTIDGRLVSKCAECKRKIEYHPSFHLWVHVQWGHQLNGWHLPVPVS